MALPDYTVSRLGLKDGNNDAVELFLKVYAGEVLTAYEKKTIVKGRHLERTIASGKSAQFPLTWKAVASMHTPGKMIDGQSIKHSEKVIDIDGLLIAPVFIASIDEAMNHYEVRSIYTNEQGIALADQYDREVLQCIILASRDSETFTGSGAGSSVTDADLAKDADILAGALMSAGQKMDELNVPDAPRFAAFKPALYWLLLQSDLVINRDYSNGGNVQKGKVWELAGIEILKSNNVPSTNINSGIAKYQGDFTKTKGVVWHPQAAGTVKLMDLALESEYLITHQGTFMVAKYAVGHDSLRPEGAVEIALP